jgi:uncharacterized protein YjbJ (UPF0337 family)/sporulation protein YlmC with PRC-barrel domain
MNKDIFEGNWKQIRRYVQEWWVHITDDELDKTEGKRDRLVGLLQKQYGYTKAQAEQALDRRLSELRQDDYIGQKHVDELHDGAPVTTLTYPRVMPVGTLTGYRVINPAGDDLGQIEDIVIDMESGRITYAVLSFGGFLGFGDKFFAIPWEVLRPSSTEEAFILHTDREALANAPGFDKNHWPEMADCQWGASIYSYYDSRPYWEE